MYSREVLILNLVTAPGTRKYRALYEFVARNNDELSFQPGDIIAVSTSQNAEPGWLAGELHGKSGWFPETYVEPLDADVDSTAMNNVPVNYPNGDPSLEYVSICRHSFEPLTVIYFLILTGI